MNERMLEGFEPDKTQEMGKMEDDESLPEGFVDPEKLKELLNRHVTLVKVERGKFQDGMGPIEDDWRLFKIDGETALVTVFKVSEDKKTLLHKEVPLETFLRLNNDNRIFNFKSADPQEN